MKALDFSNFESLNNGLAQIFNKKVSPSVLEKLTKTLKSLFEKRDKSLEYANAVGFMRATGQAGTQQFSPIESALFDANENLSKDKEQVLKLLNSEGFSKIKGLEKVKDSFIAGINVPVEDSRKINEMTNTFKETFSKRLQAVAAFLPLEIGRQFIYLMEDYAETIGNANISDAEKFAATRTDLDRRLAELGCIQLKHLVINDRNFMVADMLSDSFSGDVKSVVESAYYSQTTLMNNENYRTAAFLTETLKISYLENLGLNDEYGEKTFDDIDFASQATAGQIGVSVFDPDNYGQGLVDKDTVTTFSSDLTKELTTVFDAAIPCLSPTTDQTQQPPTPILSENLVNGTINSINLVNMLSELPEEKREEMKLDILSKSANYINAQLGQSSNNQIGFTATLEDNAITQTFINKEDKKTTETSVTTNLNEPNKYDTKQATKETSTLDVYDANGNKTSYEASIETIENTLYNSTEEALVFENVPTKQILTVHDEATNEDIIIELDDNFIPTSITGNAEIAKQIHDSYIGSLSLNDQEIYQQALYEKELEEKEKAEEEKEKAEEEEKKSENNSLISELDSVNASPPQDSTFEEQDSRHQEEEEEFIMLPKGQKQK